MNAEDEQQESKGQVVDKKAWARLLHEMADVQVRLVQMLDGGWRTLSDLIERAENTATQLRFAAELAAKAPNESGSQGKREEGAEDARSDGQGRRRGLRAPRRRRDAASSEGGEDEAKLLAEALDRIVQEAESLASRLKSPK